MGHLSCFQDCLFIVITTSTCSKHPKRQTTILCSQYSYEKHSKISLQKFLVKRRTIVGQSQAMFTARPTSGVISKCMRITLAKTAHKKTDKRGMKREDENCVSLPTSFVCLLCAVFHHFNVYQLAQLTAKWFRIATYCSTFIGAEKKSGRKNNLHVSLYVVQGIWNWTYGLTDSNSKL